MTRIRASCPTCGEVDLRPKDVILRLVRGACGVVGEASSYRFACPSCDDTVVKPADERIAQLLTTGGVPVEETDESSELAGLAAELRPAHPESPPPGPVLTRDDLLDFHLALEDVDWLAAVAETSYSQERSSI